MSHPSDRTDMSALLDVIAALRTPVSGCPWDLEQTFRSIAPYTIEEAYEVADAIERGDMADLKDELGDLLLQVVYHARMAEEENLFAFDDVVRAITNKMVRRHPHVFGSEAERAAGVETGFWERIKSEERKAKARERAALGQPPAATSRGALAGVPHNMAALTRALKLQNKAAKVGFDWPSTAPVLSKLREEIGELEEAVQNGRQDRVVDEFGDLLFVIANVARHLNVDPEASLRQTNDKFERRFRRIEELLEARGRSPADSTLEEMDALWDQAKLEERDGDEQ